MAPGPVKHLKRLNAPKHWNLAKLGGIFAPKPSNGPHSMRECLPVVLILRNKLRYALNAREVLSICMRKLVKVDGKVRTDPRFPAGLMDVVSFEKTGENFRMLYDVKGRFQLLPIDKEAAKFKLCKITKVYTGPNKLPLANTHDGRTLRYPDPIIKIHDTVKIDLETGKIVEVFHFELGQVVMITAGRNRGRVGVLLHREPHPGSFEIIQVKDKRGHTFATRLTSAFVIGNKDVPVVPLPKREGVKLSIIEERDLKVLDAAK
mmetsp:Transcript_18270/g.32305  ORF Transcript_18270/g.32305 Transcript_18270/m.32305 type:complete len:262 (-) Transcript_18270:42-827(-)